jgi:hypothetical protein
MFIAELFSNEDVVPKKPVTLGRISNLSTDRIKQMATYYGSKIEFKRGELTVFTDNEHTDPFINHVKGLTNVGGRYERDLENMQEAGGPTAADPQLVKFTTSVMTRLLSMNRLGADAVHTTAHMAVTKGFDYHSALLAANAALAKQTGRGLREDELF